MPLTQPSLLSVDVLTLTHAVFETANYSLLIIFELVKN